MTPTHRQVEMRKKGEQIGYSRVRRLKGFLAGSVVKNLPAKQETWVQSLGQEDPLVEQLIPVFLPGKFHGQRSLVGYSPWGHKESATT